ncbi:hypothetical protein BH11VER1_BH11VER1_42270 [soil metagenome]
MNREISLRSVTAMAPNGTSLLAMPSLEAYS